MRHWADPRAPNLSGWAGELRDSTINTSSVNPHTCVADAAWSLFGALGMTGIQEAVYDEQSVLLPRLRDTGVTMVSVFDFSTARDVDVRHRVSAGGTRMHEAFKEPGVFMLEVLMKRRSRNSSCCLPQTTHAVHAIGVVLRITADGLVGCIFDRASQFNGGFDVKKFNAEDVRTHPSCVQMLDPDLIYHDILVSSRVDFTPPEEQPLPYKRKHGALEARTACRDKRGELLN
jgi:hypothetical protein